MTKLIKSKIYCNTTQNSNCDNPQKLKVSQNSKHTVATLKNSNGDKTKKNSYCDKTKKNLVREAHTEVAWV